jgi:hypothetical protein
VVQRKRRNGSGDRQPKFCEPGFGVAYSDGIYFAICADLGRSHLDEDRAEVPTSELKLGPKAMGTISLRDRRRDLPIVDKKAGECIPSVAQRFGELVAKCVE